MIEKQYLDEDSVKSVNWTDSKGFYLVLHKIQLYITASSLENDYVAWMKGLDRLASFTRVFWKNGNKDYDAYETKFKLFMRQHNNTSKIFSNACKQNLLNKEYELLRDAEKLIFDNIGHLFLKTDIDDLDEDDNWLGGAA